MTFTFSDLSLGTRQPAIAVPRAQLQLLRLALPPMAKGKRLEAIRFQLDSFFPGENLAFVCKEQLAGQVMVWLWSVPNNRTNSELRFHWPEPLLEAPGESLRLVPRRPGFEAQHWQDQQLTSSQWWPTEPDESAWAGFVRACGLDADASPRPSAQTPLSSARAPQGWQQGNNLPKPDPWAGWHWQLGVLMLALAASIALGTHLQARHQLGKDKALLTQLRTERQSALNARSKHEQLQSDYEALQALSPKLQQLQLLDRVIGTGVLSVPVTPPPVTTSPAAGAPAPNGANSFVAAAPNLPPPPPPPTPMLSEWDYRNGQLKLTLDIPDGEIAMLDTTRRIEQLAHFSGLKIGLETSANNLTLNVRVDEAAMRNDRRNAPGNKP